MSGSQPQGHRSGEGTAGLWDHIRDDDQRKEREPDRHADHESAQNYGAERHQQQQQRQGND